MALSCAVHFQSCKSWPMRLVQETCVVLCMSVCMCVYSKLSSVYSGDGGGSVFGSALVVFFREFDRWEGEFPTDVTGDSTALVRKCMGNDQCVDWFLLEVKVWK